MKRPKLIQYGLLVPVEMELDPWFLSLQELYFFQLYEDFMNLLAHAEHIFAYDVQEAWLY